MNPIVEYILKRICKRLVRQGPDHKANIIQYYLFLKEAVQNEFSEDNDVTLNAFLDDCYKNASENH